MKKNECIKDWETEYYKLQQAYDELEERFTRAWRPTSISNDNNIEIIKRIDIIGNILGEFIKKQERQERKEKLEKAKQEYNIWRDEYCYSELHYSNVYEDRLRGEVNTK